MAKSRDILIFVFSGHGCHVKSSLDEAKRTNQKVKTVINPQLDHLVPPPTFAEDMKARDKYVVWDGISAEPFTDDRTWHDCIITVDMELVSVQKLCREMFSRLMMPFDYEILCHILNRDLPELVFSHLE